MLGGEIRGNLRGDAGVGGGGGRLVEGRAGQYGSGGGRGWLRMGA